MILLSLLETIHEGSCIPKFGVEADRICNTALETFTSKAPLLIESDAPIKFIIGFVNLDAKVIAIEVDKNNKRVTTII